MQLELSFVLHNITDKNKLDITITHDNRLYYYLINNKDIIIVNHILISELNNEEEKVNWTYHEIENNNIFMFVGITKDNSIDKLIINEHEIKKENFIQYKNYYIAYKLFDTNLKLPLRFLHIIKQMKSFISLL